MLTKTFSLAVFSTPALGLFATRYWDCCKPHCSWTANTYGNTPVMPSCTAANVTISDANTQSACTSATASNAYTCFNNIPYAVDANSAIGFAAVPVSDTNKDVCGKCYKLTFTGAGQSGSNPGATALAGKTMIVQASNIGYDVNHDQFDIQIPGGGVGAFDACSSQWGATDLGAQYGGFLTQCQSSVDRNNLDALKTCVRNKCNTIFSASKFAMLKQGCLWFVDWYQCADNPIVTSVEVACPAALSAISGMTRGPPPPTAPTNPPTPLPTLPPGQCPSTANCGCSWANAGTCGTNDGSTCNIACCCPFRQSNPTAAVPTSAPPTTKQPTSIPTTATPTAKNPTSPTGTTPTTAAPTNKNPTATAPTNAAPTIKSPTAASPTIKPTNPTPKPTVACPSTANCGCSWANANSCATNDGSTCNIACCCPFRQSVTVGAQSAEVNGVQEKTVSFFVYLALFIAPVLLN